MPQDAPVRCDLAVALAHTLFQAHGGRIEMELRPKQPAIARLIFPRTCLLEAPKRG